MVEIGTHRPPAIDLWDLSCPDWRERLKARRSLIPDLPLNRTLADLAVGYFDDLRLFDVPGTPLCRDAAGDWFRDLIRAVYGSLDQSTGRRFVRDLLCLVPKKNSKTTYGALGFGVVALLMNDRPGAQFAFLGPTQDIADTAFAAAAGAIRLDEGLSRILKPKDHLKEIEHLVSGATLNIMTFDPAVVSGKKFAGVMIDEIHELGSKAKAATVMNEIRGAIQAIPEQFVVMITTQSAMPPAGVFKAELEVARKVRDRHAESKTQRYLPVLYEFPEEVQRDPAQGWNDPDIWAQVQPNLGRPASIGIMMEERDKALEKGQAEFREWAAKHLNIEIGLALHANRWIGADHWEAAALKGLTFRELLRRSECVVFGADGGGLDDLFGFSAVGREKGSGRWLSWGKAYADRGVLDINKQNAPRLLDFERDGDLVFIDLTQQQNTDVSDMVEMIMLAHQEGKLPCNADGDVESAIGLDRSGVAVALLIDALLQAGFPQGAMRSVGQGYRLQSAHGQAARRLKQGSLKHAGQPLMAWCVGNAKAEQQGHATVITKQTSGVAKIDPLIALFNAVDLMSYNPQPAAQPGIFV